MKFLLILVGVCAAVQASVTPEDIKKMLKELNVCIDVFDFLKESLFEGTDKYFVGVRQRVQKEAGDEGATCFDKLLPPYMEQVDAKYEEKVGKYSPEFRTMLNDLESGHQTEKELEELQAKLSERGPYIEEISFAVADVLINMPYGKVEFENSVRTKCY